MNPGIDLNRDALSQAFEKMALDLEQKKTDIVKGRLNDLNIKIDFELEIKNRFKLIICEFHEADESESYYYNDGTEQGVRIVTFLKDKSLSPFDKNWKPFIIQSGYSYY